MKKRIQIVTIYIIIFISCILLYIFSQYGFPSNYRIYITEEQAGHVSNFLADYMRYSEEGRLDTEDMGFPKQFYLYEEDMVLSLGDMLFLFFQEQTYEREGISDPYFILDDMVFEFVSSASDVNEAYESSLKGDIPREISGISLQDFVYQRLIGEGNYEYGVGDLNIANRVFDIAFTFDIESGRYVSEAGEVGISPCEGEDYSLGLDEEELVCDNPAYVAWMSPRSHEITYTQYSYPQVSGILGFEAILSYSEDYGVPTTNFIVKKDILAFDALNKELVDRTKMLVDRGIIEVGSHTRYHTNLGLVDEEIAIEELKESKVFLEDFFMVEVHGFRAPYLSVHKDDETHARILSEAGYAYSSEIMDYYGKVPGYDLVHKPWNTGEQFAYLTSAELKEMMAEKEYLITLDHPWNMVYQDGIILEEEPEILHNYRSLLLTAISNGAIPVLLKDLRLP